MRPGRVVHVNPYRQCVPRFPICLRVIKLRRELLSATCHEKTCKFWVFRPPFVFESTWKKSNKVLSKTKPRRVDKFRGYHFSDVWENATREKSRNIRIDYNGLTRLLHVRYRASDHNTCNTTAQRFIYFQQLTAIHAAVWSLLLSEDVSCTVDRYAIQCMLKPGFHYPSWRPVNSASGNRALEWKRVWSTVRVVTTGEMRVDVRGHRQVRGQGHTAEHTSYNYTDEHFLGMRKVWKRMTRIKLAKWSRKLILKARWCICWQVMETGHPSTRAVNSGSGNRALASKHLSLDCKMPPRQWAMAFFVELRDRNIPVNLLCCSRLEPIASNWDPYCRDFFWLSMWDRKDFPKPNCACRKWILWYCCTL